MLAGLSGEIYGIEHQMAKFTPDPSDISVEFPEMESRFPKSPYTPTVSSVVKKIVGINPDLHVSRVIEIVRQSVKPRGPLAGDFAAAEVIDEEAALRWARETLGPSK